MQLRRFSAEMRTGDLVLPSRGLGMTGERLYSLPSPASGLVAIFVVLLMGCGSIRHGVT